MPRRKWNLNTTYISERLQECLRPIARTALTAVVAPMGYGKTTAVNWYLGERAKAEDTCVIRVSVYSDNLAVFWRSIQDAFAHAGFSFLQDYPCPADAASGGLLVDDICRALAGPRACYLFIDDFHLLTDGRIVTFLCALTNRLPENVHLIVAGRDRFLPGEEALRLGSTRLPDWNGTAAPQSHGAGRLCPPLRHRPHRVNRSTRCSTPARAGSPPSI